MKVRDFYSECSPELNAAILRKVDSLACHYRGILGDGWRCCIEFQRKEDKKPYYLLDVESNMGGGEYAPVKMQTLKLFPEVCATGLISLPVILDAMTNILSVSDAFFERMLRMHDFEELKAEDWQKLRELGITKWFGGIRVPYEAMVTEVCKATSAGEADKQVVSSKPGEIRVAFSGATEWQDTFFAFQLFGRIQEILNQQWTQDQIWYNLRAFKPHPKLQFWVTAMELPETLSR